MNVLKHENVRLEDIVMLSVGTGQVFQYYESEGNYDWGYFILYLSFLSFIFFEGLTQWVKLISF